MKLLYALCGVVALVALAWLGAGLLRLELVFGVVIPYVAFVLFLVGFTYRVIRWGRAAVPFRIPTTGGQQKSLPWIRHNRIGNPSTVAGVVGKMALELLFFRSLFYNTRAEKRGEALGFGSAKWLWLGALAFHWSLLVVALRHLRLFFEPVPGFVLGLGAADSFLQVGVPLLYLTDVLLLGALTFLFLRRVVAPRIRYISLSADYFALFLLIGVALTGVLMRYFFKVDMVAVKELTMGLVTLHPAIQPATALGPIFYIHLFLVSSLAAYFPWSKLMHAGGFFLAPTRNLPNNSRAKRHINPWNPQVETHSYAAYEDEFREKMLKVGLPVERLVDEAEEAVAP